MTKQVSIRSARAHELAIKLSQRHNKTITQLIEDALSEIDARDEAAAAQRQDRTQEAFRQIQEFVRKHPSDFRIEDMYDEDGLPC